MTNIKQKYKEVKIFWKWDSALSFSPLDHYRKKNANEEWKWDLKWYKIKVTVTNDMFKNKQYIYLEREELLNTLLVLSWKIKESKSIRTDKSLLIQKQVSWDSLVIFDKFLPKDKPKDLLKLRFYINNLNTIILYKLILDVLLKEIPRTTNITLNKAELISYIDTLINTSKVEVERNDKPWDNTWDFLLEFINTYNWKDYKNKISVSETFYNYIKKTNISNIDKWILLKTIKDNTINTEHQFLNDKNIDTLKCI